MSQTTSRKAAGPRKAANSKGTKTPRTPGTSPATQAPPDVTPADGGSREAPSVAYLRRRHEESTHEHFDHAANELEAALARIKGGSPAFLDTMPTDDYKSPALTDADHLLSTDLFPDRKGATENLEFLHALFSTEPVASWLAERGPSGVPDDYYRNPRVGLVNSTYVSAARQSEVQESAPNWRDAALPRGADTYICSYTREPFALAKGAPVPCVIFDSPPANSHPTDDLHFHPIHPALVEAGPAYVLWAVHQWITTRIYDLAEAVEGLGSLASTFAHMEPEDLVSDWPAMAVRTWVRAEGQEKGFPKVPRASFVPIPGAPRRFRRTRIPESPE